METKWITSQQPALVLAPMEGITDAPMRALLTERGGFSFCVSEFLRISHETLPSRIFQEHVPEFNNNCRTPSGTPVQIQLLGGNEEKMALSAQQAYELGAGAIDLNFGCPSPLVNRNDGGASLLRYPERIQGIVSAVRKAVPQHIPVSAKLRLGWASMEDIYVNAEQAALGGASWITIHARTKTQGYAPPAHWKYIAEVKRNLGIPVVANGEIWNLEDFLRCQEQTGCTHFMIGRGALANPKLAHQIAHQLGIPTSTQLETHSFTHPEHWDPILSRFSALTAHISQKVTQRITHSQNHPHDHSQILTAPRENNYTLCRIKQWLKLAHLKNSLSPWFDEVKQCKNLEEFFSILRREGF